MFEGCTNLQVDTISASCDGAVLEINHEGSTPEYWNLNMFSGCKGSAKGNIKAGGHYCIKEYKPALITLTFDMQGHGTQVESQTIASGSKFEKPDDPTAEGYEFRDWFSNAKGLGEAFDFNQAVTADKDTTITIYAKWRDPVAWEQFKKDLDAYSYVEYDSTYTYKFKIHLATTQDAQVQPLKDAAFIEASEEVLANYDFDIFVYQLLKEYPYMIDELGKCAGEEAPIKPGQNPMLALIAAYTQLPYRANGLNAVCGLYSSYVDLVYKEWAETNYENDAEICKCMFNSDVFFKGTARMMEAFDASEK